jgi:hypothetical protein
MASWYDMMMADAQREKEDILRMSPAEWTATVQHMLRTTRRGGIVDTIARIQALDAERVASAAASEPVLPQGGNPEWRVWRDMVEEPEKYGEDIAEWLELDAKLRAGSGRWRIEAYWLEKEAELETAEKEEQAEWRAIYSLAARQAADAGMRAWAVRDVKRHVARFNRAILRIQAAVRGHQLRTKLNFRDCCMCLAHRICPLETEVGMMCRECAEDGPHADMTNCDDPWDWFRADYVDRTLPVLEVPMRGILGMGGCIFCSKDYVCRNPEYDAGFCGEACETKYRRWIDNQHDPRVPQDNFNPLTLRAQIEEEKAQDIERQCHACRQHIRNPNTVWITDLPFCSACSVTRSQCGRCSRSTQLPGSRQMGHWFYCSVCAPHLITCKECGDVTERDSGAPAAGFCSRACVVSWNLRD